MVVPTGGAEFRGGGRARLHVEVILEGEKEQGCKDPGERKETGGKKSGVKRLFSRTG